MSQMEKLNEIYESLMSADMELYQIESVDKEDCLSIAKKDIADAIAVLLELANSPVDGD